MGEGDQKVQTGYKVAKSWGYNVQCGDIVNTALYI